MKELEERPVSGFILVVITIVVTAVALWYGHADVRVSSQQPPESRVGTMAPVGTRR